jgi:hypothetical protein
MKCHAAWSCTAGGRLRSPTGLSRTLRSTSWIGTPTPGQSPSVLAKMLLPGDAAVGINAHVPERAWWSPSRNSESQGPASSLKPARPSPGITKPGRARRRDGQVICADRQERCQSSPPHRGALAGAGVWARRRSQTGPHPCIEM